MKIDLCDITTSLYRGVACGSTTSACNCTGCSLLLLNANGSSLYGCVTYTYMIDIHIDDNNYENKCKTIQSYYSANSIIVKLNEK